MKKGFILIFLFAFVIPAYAQDDSSSAGSPVVVNFNIGNLGFGVNLPVNNSNDLEGHFSIVNVGFENKLTNFGMSFCPFMFISWMSTEEIYYEDYGGSGYYEEEITSTGGIFLVNLMAYWNIVNYTFGGGSNFFLGPFASINYLMLEEESFSTKDYVFTLGMQLGLRAHFGNFQYNLFSFEVGYRNINGKHNYYIGGKFDIVTLAIASAFTAPYWHNY